MGSPYFLAETNELGSFYVAHALLLTENLDVWFVPDPEHITFIKEEEINYSSHPEKYLKIGLDIKETATRNLSLLIEANDYEEALSNIIKGCRKFAAVSSHDYVALESAILLENQLSEEIYYKVMPRLFNKIVDH